MKHLFFTILLFFSIAPAFAQDNGDRIQAIRVSYISEKLDLTAEQATRFWPIYNQYDNERRSIRRRMRDAYQNQNPSANKEQSRAFIEASIEYQSQELDLKKKYKDRLLTVISPQQLAALYQAEREFKKILIDQLKDKSGD